MIVETLRQLKLSMTELNQHIEAFQREANPGFDPRLIQALAVWRRFSSVMEALCVADGTKTVDNAASPDFLWELTALILAVYRLRQMCFPAEIITVTSR